MFAPPPAPYARAVAALEEADRGMTAAVLALSGIADGDGGLPAEFVLRLEGRRPAWEARALIATAEALRHMPITRGLLERGVLSFPQVRALCRAVSAAGPGARAACDTHIGARAEALAAAEPEQILAEVEDLIASADPGRDQSRDDRTFDRRYLHIQPHLGGGAHLSGEVDDEGLASISTAIEAAASAPDPELRSEQRLDALVAVCDSFLAGGTSGPRPRARLLATVQLSELTRDGAHAGAQMLAEVMGGRVRLTPVTTEALSCDAETVAVLFDGARPVAVSDAQKAIPDKVRTALVARDQGCKFPGCSVPARWTDAHHIHGRGAASSHDPAGMLLLCRRCHRRVHRFNWKIAPDPDGGFTFRRGRRRFVTPARAPTPAPR